MTKTCIFYIRHNGDGEKRAAQIQKLEESAARKCLKVSVVFEECSESSARPTLANMVSYVGQNHVDAVLVASLDRIDDFATSLDRLGQLVSELSRRGTALVLPLDNLDSEMPASEFLAKAHEAIGRAKSSIKAERVRNSLQAAKAAGAHLGRPTNRNDQLIMDLRKQGLTLAEVSERANASIWAVSRALKNAQAT